jgi:ABC-type Co2+ transport system permease subunit
MGGVYPMRAHTSVPVVLTAFVSAGCAQISDKIGSSDAATGYAKCTADVRATAESQLISARLWLGDGTDGVSKLTDAKPFSPVERDALTQVHGRLANAALAGIFSKRRRHLLQVV